MKIERFLIRQRDVDGLWYAYPEEPFAPEVLLSPEIWRALGEPSTIAVTIQRGEKYRGDEGVSASS